VSYGLGYIGLPTAALLAIEAMISCVDLDQRACRNIIAAKSNSRTGKLDTFVNQPLIRGRLKADIKPAEADVFIIAVPTPFHEGFVSNIDYGCAATLSIVPYIRPVISLFWSRHLR